MEINMHDKRSIMKQESMELLVKRKEDLELLLKKKENNLKLFDVKINALFDLHSKHKEVFEKYKAICEDVLAVAKETDERRAKIFPFNGLNISCSNIEGGLIDTNTSVKAMQDIKKDWADEISLLKQKIGGYNGRIKQAETANAKAKIKVTEKTETVKIKITNEINSSAGGKMASRYRETVGVLQKLKSASAMEIYSFLTDDVAKKVSYSVFQRI
jgi:hypothetical protein